MNLLIVVSFINVIWSMISDNIEVRISIAKLKHILKKFIINTNFRAIWIYIYLGHTFQFEANSFVWFEANILVWIQGKSEVIYHIWRDFSCHMTQIFRAIKRVFSDSTIWRWHFVLSEVKFHIWSEFLARHRVNQKRNDLQRILSAISKIYDFNRIYTTIWFEYISE